MSRLDGALLFVVKYLAHRGDQTEDFILSKVHYKVTFTILLTCGILTGVSSWYSPIECTRVDTVSTDMMFVKQFCYSRSIFVVSGPYAQDGVFPGIDNTHSSPKNEKVYVQYYKWVTFCLLLQAACFQIPHCIWKVNKGGYVRVLVDRLTSLGKMPPTEREAHMKDIAAQFSAREPCDNSRYLHWFVASQTLYFINAALQVLFAEKFLTGQFISLMPRWLVGGQQVLDVVFPKMAKCFLKDHGIGGGISERNVMCYLGMNVLIEKVYLLLWVVFMLDVVVATVQMMYVLAILFSSQFRNSILRICLTEIEKPVSAKAVSDTDPVPGPCQPQLQEIVLEQVASHVVELQKGEWLLLKFVKERLNDTAMFQQFIKTLTQKWRSSQ